MCGITGIITKEVLSNDDIDELKAVDSFAIMSHSSFLERHARK